MQFHAVPLAFCTTMRTHTAPDGHPFYDEDSYILALVFSSRFSHACCLNAHCLVLISCFVIFNRFYISAVTSSHSHVPVRVLHYFGGSLHHFLFLTLLCVLCEQALPRLQT